ncbi:DUF2637 domain-containing protein [Mycolicibacterium sp. CBMA 226]|uniref:DUF2637 domain-containing protein n=1 Tax=Mycolicibacterium sp. CBMA 226 TaxID=2606611 RepID=UPI0012DD36F0|nr:DUF2637 domain-containing protein [Mycolicibacterium sp. CBMA 226]MUL78947.1 DUF2637 domain-containing protein [Mycolicibacterium sp. CBMA 226]QGW61256.1 hypothetical protein ICEMyc226_00224 [Mycolicibacterium sp.]
MSARSWWRTVLIAAVTTSIAGNVYHALLTAPPALRVPAALTAALPPLAVFGVTEGLMRSAGAGTRKVAYRAGVAAAVGIALIAFVLSFTALRSLAVMMGEPPSVAAGLPLLADLLVAASSVMLLSFRPASRVVAEAAPPVVTAPALATPIVPPPIPEPIAFAPERVSAQEPAPVIRAPEPAPEPQTGPMTVSDVSDPASVKPAAVEMPVPVQQPDRRPAATTSVTPITAARTSVDNRAHYRAVAEELVDHRGLNVRRGKDLVAAVLCDRESGMRNNEIAGRHEVHHSVVKKIFDAADELAAV